MTDTTDIEKKSLEAHVELCAERYRALEIKLETVKEQIVGLESVVRSVHEILNASIEKRNSQVLSWGVTVIGILVSMVAFFAGHYFNTL